jgi:Protein of unknown function (DUF2490)
MRSQAARELGPLDFARCMFHRPSCLAVLAVLFSLTGDATAQSIVIPQTDTQQWTEVQFYVPVTKQIDFGLIGTLRLGRDISRPVDERIGAGLSIRVGKYLTVAPNYQYIGMQPFRGRKVWENRLSLPIQVRFNAGKFRITDRNLFERRLRDPGVDATRYRNRLQVDHPVGSKKWKLSLYVADEVFYDWSVNDWVRNRFSIGVSKLFNEHFTQEYYYMRQNDGRTFPGDLNVIGTTLRFRM